MPGQQEGHGEQLDGLAEALELSVPVAETDWAAADWAVADWVRLPLELPAARLGVATGEPVSVGVPPAELKPLRVVAAEDPVRDWPVAGSTGTLLESVGDGLAEVQVGLAEAVGLAGSVGLVESVGEGLGLAETVGLAEAEVCAPPGAEVPGLGVRAGGRLDLGGRTLVTSLTTGSGLSGTAEAPSR